MPRAQQEADAVGPLNAQHDGQALLQRPVRYADGRAIGAVISVALGIGGRIDAVIVDVGSREVAIPYAELLIRPNRPVTVLMSAQELQELPEYRYADPAQRGSAFRSMSVQTSPLA